MALRLLVTAQSDPQGRIFRYDFDDDRGQILLGRRGGVDVLLPHASVSLVHARIERRGDGFVIIDDDSVNGTQLNGARLEAGSERPLKQGDRIGIAEFTLEVDEARGDEGPMAAESSISIARRMVADVLGVLGPGDQHPTLAVIDGALDGVRLTLSEPGRAYVVGREAGCDFELADPSVARRHARVLRSDRGDVVVADLGSPSGLYVNDRFVAGDRPLRDGDLLAIGRLRLRFSDPAETYLRRLEQVPSQPAPRAITESRLPRLPRVTSRSRLEVLIIAGAILVGATALAALVWVLLS